jgi:hypothetical protein
MMTPALRINKNWKRRLRKLRDRLATRLLDTPLGRKLLIGGIGTRVLTLTVDCGDHVMSVSPSDYIGRKVFRKGHFERDHVDRLLAALRERGLQRRGDVLLELGGNIGTQTVYFALSRAYRKISPSSRIPATSSCWLATSPRTSWRTASRWWRARPATGTAMSTFFSTAPITARAASSAPAAAT